MTEKKRFPLALALMVGMHLMEEWKDDVVRIAIAGSIRRNVEEVGDIELLYIPKMVASTDPKLDMFSDPPQIDQLDKKVRELVQQGILTVRMNVAGRAIGMGVENKFVTSVATGIPIDIFRTTVANWGMAMVVRTGPAEWNKLMMTKFRTLGMEGHAYGGVTRAGKEVTCPNESDVFELLGMLYLEPEYRHPNVLGLR